MSRRRPRYVGIDLAWGHRRPTGVAVLDGRGRLLHVSAQRTDEQIEAALAEHVAGPCVVALDAPLVVTNPTGKRPAETALDRDFRRFDAGTHPTNLGKPELADGPRGGLLAARLGLDLAPRSDAARRAVEVYPHAATVALFRLGRTLKYKQKPGRTVVTLREALLELLRLLEGLAGGTPPLRVRESEAWAELRRLAETATRKRELRHVEDQVDAVLCAYVALYADRRPGDVTTYGEETTGAIVTPTLPADLAPSASPARSAGSAEPAGSVAERRDPVRAAVKEYAERHAELREATATYARLLTTLLDDAGINYLSVESRTKSVASFAAKADRTADGRPVFTDPLAQITDQIGVRVLTYLHSDVVAVADLLGVEMQVLGDRDMGEETASEGRFGYASRHLLVGDPARAEGEAAALLAGRHAQVQVRTVLQHAWAEFEHAIRYKGTVPEEHASDLDRRFTLAAGLLELADREFTEISERVQAAVAGRPEPEADDPRIRGEDLATFLGERYADAGWSRPDHYAWVSGLLLELGITSLEELAGLLTSVDTDAIHERMGYRYPAGAVRRLDDSLLAVFGQRYVDLTGNAHRVPLLRTRLTRLTAPPEH